MVYRALCHLCHSTLTSWPVNLPPLHFTTFTETSLLFLKTCQADFCLKAFVLIVSSACSFLPPEIYVPNSPASFESLLSRQCLSLYQHFLITMIFHQSKADLIDIMGSVTNHRNKANITIKCTVIFCWWRVLPSICKKSQKTKKTQNTKNPKPSRAKKTQHLWAQ